MLRTISDFLGAWKYQNESTLKILRALTPASLEQRVTPAGRSLGQLAWHVACAVTEMGSQAGLPLKAAEGDAPADPAQIAAVYERDAQALAAAVQANWTDAMLDEETPMYGESWKRGLTLSILVGHEIHHRGQMTVLMRQAGLKVPGVYGPAYEEWAAMGMPPQA
jgi:uncharacterized damage-inducible protein DinB